jgi:hypothetical protein
MNSPIVAMLWENWRLTRVEAAQRLALGIVAGSAALVLLGDAGATVAFWILIVLHGFFYFSIAKLNGGRFMDGYKPGFPLYLFYTRPVSTVTFVGVAMAYDALTCAALYFASVALLGFAFGQPLPLFSATVCLVAYHFAYICIQYSTRSRVVQWIGASVVTLPMIPLLRDRLAPPLQIELSLAENALMVLVGVVSFGLTVAGVARQRRGDARAAIPRMVTRSAFSEWLADLFRLPCPTTSATRAQIWFDLKSSGLPVLAIGLALAILIPLLFVITTRLDVVLSGFYTQPATRLSAVVVAMFSLPAVLILGGNAFGIRARQGRTYASAFEATQAGGTAWMAGLKVLVRSVCLLAALVAVGTSVWTSASVIPFDVLGDNDTFIEKSRAPLSGQMRAIEGAVRAMSADQQIALIVVAVLLVTIMVAVRASLAALRAHYRRRVLIASWALMLYSLAIVGAGRSGFEAMLAWFFRATPWMAAATITVATVYLCWVCISERLLTLRHVGGAILVCAAFGAAGMTLLRAAGLQLAGMSTTATVWLLLAALLPFTVSLLAPWSLSRVRHT